MTASHVNGRAGGIALFGSVFLDHVMTGFGQWPLPGEEAIATGYLREAGGGCFNTACGLAKLGHQATCFAAVGAEDGEWLVQRVNSFGVDTRYIRRVPAASGVSVSVSLPTDRTFFTFPGANSHLAEWLDEPSLPAALAQFCHVHFALPVPVFPGVALIRELRRSGCRVSLDVGWDREWLRDQSNFDVLREVDFFMPNLAEAQAMTGRAQWRDCLSFFRDVGAPAVALKLGSDGAALLAGAEIFKAEALPLPCVDSTGAGDAFNAGFLHGVLRRDALETCLAQGVVCGSLSIRQPGSLSSFPSLDEVTAFHEQHY